MLNLAIIGCGYWGPNLVRNFASHEDVNVAAVCDIRRERLDFIHSLYPGIEQFTTDSSDIVNSPDIDAVVIATPVTTHFGLGQSALKSGKHLLLEKPLTATVEQAEQLINLAEQKNLRLMVDHTFVYTGAVRTIKQSIDKNELGDLYYFDSVRVNLGLFQHDVNVIWDLASHDVSIMDYLLGQSPSRVSAVGVDHLNSGIENIAYLTLQFENNLLGHIHVNWLAPVKVRKTVISGSKKMVIYDDVEPSEKVKIYNNGIEITQSRDQIYDLLIQYRTGDMYAPRLDQTEALKLVSREFYDAINENRTPLTDGHAGLRVVKILKAAAGSVKANGEMIELA